jgi:RNA polymerase sigma-70 factor (ECF subfamily)
LTEKGELAGLVKQVQRGDLEAFGIIYDRFFDQIYAYVLRQVGSPADAEDIVSGVFLEAVEKIDRFTWRGAGFAAWLFRIARNDVIDHFRRRGVGARETATTEDIVELADAGRVEDLVEKAWTERELMQAIAGLSEEQRTVILLKLMFNFSNRQIGGVIGKSEGAVKALKHRALLSLRKIMDEGEDC